MSESANLMATRVIVSCDASPLGTTAIDAAVVLAHRLDAELKGIFVEDINLIRTAALPFTREVALSTALARRMHSGQLQRVLAQQAQSVHDVLREAASTLKLQWSFQVVRGAPLGSVLDAMREMDLAVFGLAGRFSTGPAAAAPLMARQPVMVVFDGTPAAQRALDVAAALAQDTQARLVVAVIDMAGDVTDLRTQVMLQLEHRHSPTTQTLFVTLKRRDAGTVARAVEAYAPGVLLWVGIAGEADRATLATLVDVLKCPVVLVA